MRALLPWMRKQRVLWKQQAHRKKNGGGGGGEGRREKKLNLILVHIMYSLYLFED
jgi:hypothetical protein